jgi:hypothetical protein
MNDQRDDQLSLPGLGPDDDEQLSAMRTSVSVRLRREWIDLDGLRQSSADMMQAAFDEEDPRIATERWRAAKLAAETILATFRALAIKQQGERAAWGVDDNSTAPTIIIERSYGRAL